MDKLYVVRYESYGGIVNFEYYHSQSQALSAVDAININCAPIDIRIDIYGYLQSTSFNHREGYNVQTKREN